MFLGQHLVPNHARESRASGGKARTGMPEFVLMPAPVTTTTLRALSRALATSWRRWPWLAGSICWVGMNADQRPAERASGFVCGGRT